MPSRSKVSAEMKKYGQIDDVQVMMKANCYLFVYSNETYAEAACRALADKKASLPWNVAEVTATPDPVLTAIVKMSDFDVRQEHESRFSVCLMSTCWHQDLFSRCLIPSHPIT